MAKLVVFCRTKSEAARAVSAELGVRAVDCAFIPAGSPEMVRGYANIKFVVGRPLDEYERQYVEEHGMTAYDPDTDSPSDLEVAE